jgi:hypothetical protein
MTNVMGRTAMMRLVEGALEGARVTNDHLKASRACVRCPRRPLYGTVQW